MVGWRCVLHAPILPIVCRGEALSWARFTHQVGGDWWQGEYRASTHAPPDDESEYMRAHMGPQPSSSNKMVDPGLNSRLQ